MISELAAKLEFPEEAMVYLEESFIKIKKLPHVMRRFQEAMDLFFVSRNQKHIEILREISDKSGVPPCTVDIIFLLMCAYPLKYMYAEAGYHEAAYYENMSDLKCKLMECKNLNGVWGISSIGWFENLFYMKRFKLGRMQFQKGECKISHYKDLVKEGDMIINCHVPSGEPLNIEAVKSSLHRAYEFYKNDFKDGRVIVFAHSWLLYTPIIEKLNPDSNIRKFYDLFNIIQLEADEQNKNFWRIFNVRWPQNLDVIKPHNSLQRIIVEHMKAGGTLGVGLGVIVLDEDGGTLNEL